MKTTLYEVSIIRPIVIFLLLVLHAFTQLDYPSPITHTANGELLQYDNYLSIPLYYWIIKLIQGFRIETITFIAGYVFAFQSIDKKKKYSFWQFAKKKFNRLVIPYFVFGLLYFFLFVYTKDFSWSVFLCSSYPVGHLWFLPMLFWAFLVLWMYDKYKKYQKVFFCISLTLSIIPLSLPFNIIGLTKLLHFIFYSIFGYSTYKYKDTIIKRLLRNRHIFTTWLLYITMILLYYSLLENTHFNESSIVISIAKMAIRFLICISGLLAIYLTTYKFVNRESYQPSKFTLHASNLCYGVYVYHQFILQILNRYVPLSHFCGYYILPWIGLLITLFVSIFITHYTLKTSVGRKLIG